MHLLFRTYAHSKKASFVSVAGLVIALLFVLGAIICLVACPYLQPLPVFFPTIMLAALSVFIFRSSRHLAEHIAILDLEKKLGKPILDVH